MVLCFHLLYTKCGYLLHWLLFALHLLGSALPDCSSEMWNLIAFSVCIVCNPLADVVVGVTCNLLPVDVE